MAKHIVFGNLQGVEDTMAYVSNHLQNFGESINEIELEAQKVLTDFSNTVLPLVSGRSIEELADQSTVRDAEKCFLNMVENWFQFSEGETLVEDTLSCLEQAYGDFVAGSPVLQRVTNKATVYYIDTDHQIQGNTLVSSTEPQVTATEFDNKPSAATSMMEQIASALVDETLGQVGSFILDSILGIGNGVDFKQLEEDFARIVRDANIEQTVNEQSGYVNAIYKDMTGPYHDDKADGFSKKHLYNYLEVKEGDLEGNIKALQAPLFQEKGLAVFIAAKNLQFCMFQEMCIQNYHVARPEDSELKGTIAKRGPEAAAYLQEQYDKALAKRLSYVTVAPNTSCVSGDRGSTVCSTSWDVTDNFKSPGTLIASFGSGQSHGTQAQHKAHAAKKKYDDHLTETMSWMLRVRDNWNDLANHPLGRDSN